MHTIDTCLSSQFHTIDTCLRSQFHTVDSGLNSQFHTVDSGLNSQFQNNGQYCVATVTNGIEIILTRTRKYFSVGMLLSWQLLPYETGVQ